MGSPAPTSVLMAGISGPLVRVVVGATPRLGESRRGETIPCA